METGMVSSLNDVGMARSSLLSLKLDKQRDSNKYV
jgi:hypothetical protein